MAGKEEIEVVISGIAGLLPKSKNIEEFQQLLFDHEDMIQSQNEESGKYSNQVYISLKASFMRKLYSMK